MQLMPAQQGMAEAESALAPAGAGAASPAPGDDSPVVIDQVALARLYGEPLFLSLIHI